MGKNESNKDVIIGIDLGTTNSVVAVVDSTGPKVLDNREAKSQTRSVVGLKKRKKAGAAAEEILIGETALDNWPLAPRDTIISVKRLMGRAFADPEVAEVATMYLYEIVEPTDGTKDSVRVLMGGKEYSPVDISAKILKKLKEDAEYRIGRSVKYAVITVPAYFSQVQRDATRKAGIAAGLNVIKLLDEPTAAAVSFGVDASDSDEPKTLLVYDLGGGTFDISILMLGGGILAPLSLMGDMWLGGDNFDQVIVDYVLSEVRDEHGIDPTSNKRFMVALKKAAKDVKERLSNALSADLIVAAILQDNEGNPIDVEIEFTREQYNAMISHLVDKTVALTNKAVEKAGITVSEIDHVLMAGNSTCIPAVQEAMERLFGKEKVLRKDNPKHVVALGAAMVGERVRGVVCQAPSQEDSSRECGHVNPLDAASCEKCKSALPVAEHVENGQPAQGALPPEGGIAPFYYGVRGAGDTFNVFIKGGDPYPTPDAAIEPQTPETRIPNQRMIRIPVYGGDNLNKASLNEKQGEALAVLPAGLPKGAKVHLRLWLDKDGVFNLSAHLADGSDLRPVIVHGDADGKAVEAIEDLERQFVEKAAALLPEDLQRLDKARERAYSKMRDGDYSGATAAARKCAEDLGQLGKEAEADQQNVQVEQLIQFVDFVLQKYYWILKTDPDLQGRLEVLIDEVKGAIKRRDQAALSQGMDQLLGEFARLPSLIQQMLGMEGVIASSIKPLDPALARDLDQELDEMETRFKRQFEDIERLPRARQQEERQRWNVSLRDEIHALEERIHKCVEEMHRNRKKGVPCPKCAKDIPPGVVRCINCGEDLRDLDFKNRGLPSFREL